MDGIGIIAGNRNLPLILIDQARKKGVQKIYAVGFENITNHEIDNIADDVFWISVGQFGKMIKYFKRMSVNNIFMVGQIPPKLVFKDIRFDARGLKLFGKVYKKNADSIFGTIANEMKEEGLILQDSTRYLKDLIPKKGILTKSKIKKDIKKDIEYGRIVAKQIAHLDIGQTIVLKSGAVLAVEAYEGTDATIIRGAELGGENSVVIKVSSPKQDMRFDVPVVGKRTIDVLVDVKASALAIDAGKTLLLEKDEMIKKANENGLILAAY